MGVMNFLKNALFDHDSDMVDIVKRKSISGKIDTKGNKKRPDNIYVIFHDKTAIKSNKKLGSRLV